MKETPKSPYQGTCNPEPFNFEKFSGCAPFHERTREFRGTSSRLPVNSHRLRRFEVTNCCVKLVAAPWVAEPYNVTVVLGQRVSLYRFTGPRAGLVDAVGDVEVGHPILVVQISVPPCVLYVYLQF